MSKRPEEVFEVYFRDSGFSVLYHSFRQKLIDENIEIARHGIDDANRVFEQLNHYALECREITGAACYCATTQMRVFAACQRSGLRKFTDTQGATSFP